MPRERAMVQRNPGLLVLAGYEGPHPDTVSQLGPADPGLQGPPHLPQRPGSGEAGRAREPGRGGQLAVRPQAQSAVTRFGRDRLPKDQSDALAARRGVDHHLRGRPLDRVGRVQVPVAGQPAVPPDEHVAGVQVAAVPQVQQHVLGQRADAVLVGRVLHQRQDLGCLLGWQRTADLDPDAGPGGMASVRYLATGRHGPPPGCL